MFNNISIEKNSNKNNQIRYFNAIKIKHKVY